MFGMAYSPHRRRTALYDFARNKIVRYVFKMAECCSMWVFWKYHRGVVFGAFAMGMICGRYEEEAIAVERERKEKNGM